MTEQIIAIIEQIVERKLRELHLGEIGIVTEVFPHRAGGDNHNYSCHVRLTNPDAQGNFLELRQVPVATNHIGSVAIPNVGDLVLIAFIHGSLHQPVITGRLYHSELRPPCSTVNQIVQQLPCDGKKKPQECIEVQMSYDPEGRETKRQITIKMQPQVEIAIDETQFSVKLPENKTQLQLAHNGKHKGRAVVTSGDSKITMAESGAIAVESPKEITIKAGKQLTLSAEKIAITSQGDTQIKAGGKLLAKSKGSQKHQGLDITLAGKKSATVTGKAGVKIKGSTVDLN